MSFEKTLEGTLEAIDRHHRTLSVRQEIKKEGRFELLLVGFSLAPNVSVMSSRRGILKLSALKTGQHVLVHYVTESGGKRIATTIALVEPTSKPTPSVGVRVAG